MKEKIILEFKINGFKYLYTAEINNNDHFGESIEGKKYIHIKCKIFSNKTKSYIGHGTTICLSDSKYLNTKLVNEAAQLMEISYNKNKFIKNLIKFINEEEYLSKILDFDRLEDIFNLSLHKNKLSCVFDNSIFIVKKIIYLDTKIEIYPYVFNNKLYLHISVSYINLNLAYIIKRVFEYELINHNYKTDYYKDAYAILSEIFNRNSNVISEINDNSIDTIVNMIEYCFNENLFRNIEQIEYFKSESKEE